MPLQVIRLFIQGQFRTRRYLFSNHLMAQIFDNNNVTRGQQEGLQWAILSGDNINMFQLKKGLKVARSKLGGFKTTPI